MDIVFTLYSLAQLIYSVKNYVTEQAPMDFFNPMIKGYTIICAMALFVAICIINKPEDERLNFVVTQCLNFVVWLLVTVITYLIITAGSISVILGNVCMLTAFFIVLAFGELLVLAIISLEFRNKL